MPRSTDVSWMTRLRCTFWGHMWMVQQFDIATHRMLLICFRCGEHKDSHVPRITMRADDKMHQPQVGEH